jgi:hypothetical protein
MKIKICKTFIRMFSFPEHPLFAVDEATTPPVTSVVELPFTVVIPVDSEAIVVAVPETTVALEFYGAKK